MFDGPTSIFRKIDLFGQSQCTNKDEYSEIGLYAENAGYMDSDESYQDLKKPSFGENL
jgi:hypothetical protein